MFNPASMMPGAAPPKAEVKPQDVGFDVPAVNENVLHSMNKVCCHQLTIIHDMKSFCYIFSVPRIIIPTSGYYVKAADRPTRLACHHTTL